MSKSIQDVMDLIREHDIKMVNTNGQYRHVTILAENFPEELIANFIKGKRAECAELSKIPHPAEFDKCYNL